MGLNAAFVDEHIARWEKILGSGMYAYRRRWPSRLFHHTPIENAVDILKNGELLSRNASKLSRARDVAGAEVVNTRDHAHSSARLYFRPKTPTQYHIEGVRKLEDCQYGPDAHSPILIVFVFKAKEVLTSPGVKFCDRNMQQGLAQPGETQQYFSSIPFEKVYHEGATGGDRSIISHRCAEVLATSPLNLEDTLQWIRCRSTPERDTLLHLLGEEGEHWANKIVVSDDLIVFQKEFAFVESLSLSNNGVIFRLNARRDGRNIDVRLQAWDSKGRRVVNFHDNNIAPYPPKAKSWLVEASLKDDTYTVQMHLEGHLAFSDEIQLGDVLF